MTTLFLPNGQSESESELDSLDSGSKDSRSLPSELHDDISELSSPGASAALELTGVLRFFTLDCGIFAPS